ncbi:MAG: prolipoprotein diacylglyceryl transferase [Phycisphaerae bacterium]|nr:prolipoprotein diacylglyceryl transferase [Phycisphaerae bacterium]
MHPELFKIPFTELTVKSYGLMVVIGFIFAIWVIRRLSCRFTSNPEIITNAALYSLICGILGARLFYVVLYFDQFRGDFLSIFAIWRGGLVLLGGVIVAMTFLLLYMMHNKLPIRRYLDVLAIGLFLALGFGRIGCFLNGCCYGKPTDLPWAVSFPYGSLAYRSQIAPDPTRNRPNAYIQLPSEYFGYLTENGGWNPGLKPKNMLTTSQLENVENGRYRPLPVHPTQLYSSLNGFFCAFLLYLFWRRSQNYKGAFTKPGSTFALMLILYGIARFLIEFIRDDNPYEFDSLTVSQNISIVMFSAGLILMLTFAKMKKMTPRTCRHHLTTREKSG